MPKKPRRRSVRPLLLTTDPAEAWAKLEWELKLAGALFKTDPDAGKIGALSALVAYLCNRGLNDNDARLPVMAVLRDLRDKGQKLTANEKRLRAEVGAAADALIQLGRPEQAAAEAVAAVLTELGIKLGSRDPEAKLWEAVRNLRTKLLKGSESDWDVAWFARRYRDHVLAPIDDGADRADIVLRRLKKCLPALKT